MWPENRRRGTLLSRLLSKDWGFLGSETVSLLPHLLSHKNQLSATRALLC